MSIDWQCVCLFHSGLTVLKGYSPCPPVTIEWRSITASIQFKFVPYFIYAGEVPSNARLGTAIRNDWHFSSIIAQIRQLQWTADACVGYRFFCTDCAKCVKLSKCLRAVGQSESVTVWWEHSDVKAGGCQLSSASWVTCVSIVIWGLWGSGARFGINLQSGLCKLCNSVAAVALDVLISATKFCILIIGIVCRACFGDWLKME